MAGLPLNAVRLDYPPLTLSPNARAHYMQKHRCVRAYRDSARISGLHGRKIAEPIVCVVPIVKVRRKRDLDNVLASLKPALDGLTDAGWWSDDSEIRGIHVCPEVLVPSLADRCVLVLSCAEHNFRPLAEMIEEFRSACLAGNGYTAAYDKFNISL